MPNPLRPLMLALEQAEKARDAAQAVFQEARRAFEAAQQQALQLNAYRGEYQQRWGAQAGQNRQAAMLRVYQGFLDRLHQAIEQQQQALGAQARRLEALRQSLQAHDVRAASIRKLIERRQQELQRAQGRREQKTTDEQAARMAWSHRLSVPGPISG